MDLYPTVPICVQLTDYELETPHLGVAPIYRTVPPQRPSLYPPLYDVEPPFNSLPEYVALVGVNQVFHQNRIMCEKETMNKNSFNKLEGTTKQCIEKDQTQLKETVKQSSECKELKLTNKEVILNRRNGKFGLKTGVYDGRVLVTGVSRSGAAGLAGMKPGDQLLVVNGRVLSGLRGSEVQRVIRACPSFGIKFTFRTRTN